MDTNYLKILDKVDFAFSDIESLFNKVQLEKKSFENRQAYYIVENLLEYLDRAKDRLKRISFPAIEGWLQEQDNNKFELIRIETDRSIGYQFSCGSYLEVWNDEEKQWEAGRVEHTTKYGNTGYYFVCSDMDNPFLYTGMKARVRREHSCKEDK